jgi:hypothetical protein
MLTAMAHSEIVWAGAMNMAAVDGASIACVVRSYIADNERSMASAICFW